MSRNEQMLLAQNESKKIKLKRRQEDNKILNRDVNFIKDLMLCEVLKNK